MSLKNDTYKIQLTKNGAMYQPIFQYNPEGTVTIYQRKNPNMGGRGPETITMTFLSSPRS